MRNWDALYENNRSRDLIEIKWVPIPTKQDGDGYTDMVSMQDGAGLYGCWIGIVVVAAKCKPRGTLIRETGEPHTAQSIARVSHLPEGLMSRTLSVSVRIKWLDVVPYERPVEIPQSSAEIPHPPAVPSIPFSSIPDPGLEGAGRKGEFPEVALDGTDETGEILEQLRQEIGAHFKKPIGERWSHDAEHALFKVCKSPTVIHEWHTIKSYHSKAGAWPRQSIKALLENWSDELDKARRHEPNSHRANPPKPTDSF